ncbi:MAG: AtpZ/AtpI family protein [Paracoccaceae bacterium]|nr:AtpZ/AtpI family protein [Paracoccaceae bacterium]MDE3240112.1 AtpZ/AtpI family protein [Paracoccaceae bacterium]
MGDDNDDERLRRLDQRIAEAKKSVAPPPRKDADFSRAEIGWRMVTELVAGLLIGFGIGYGLDRVFHTLPLFLVLFMMLGFIAGVRVMLRSAKELQTKIAAEQTADEERD